MFYNHFKLKKEILNVIVRLIDRQGEIIIPFIY